MKIVSKFIAAVQRCYIKKALLKILEHFQENIRFGPYGMNNYACTKKVLCHKCFPDFFQTFGTTIL